MVEGEFWNSTPFLTRKFIEAAAERERDAYKRVLFGAWNSAAFARQKRLQKLEPLLRKLDRRASRRQSPEEILRTVELWNRALGGRDLRPKPQQAAAQDTA